MRAVKAKFLRRLARKMNAKKKTTTETNENEIGRAHV